MKLAVAWSIRRRSAPPRRRRERSHQAGGRHREECDGRRDVERARAVPEQPPARSLDELSRFEVHRRLHVDVEGGVEGFDRPRQIFLGEDRPRGLVRAHDLGSGCAGFLREAERERRAGPVHETVHECRGDDLPREWVHPYAFEEALPQRGGEVAHEIGDELGLVGQRRHEQLLLEGDLGVGEQDCELGDGQAEARIPAARDRLVVGQPFDRAVEVLVLFERAHEARVDVFHLRRLHLRVVECPVLAVVVAEYEGRDVVGHRLEQRVAFVDRELTGATAPSTRILMFTSWSEVSTPALLSIASVLIKPPWSAYSTRPSCVNPRLPPSPTDRHAKLGAVHPDRVGRLVADVGVGLGVRLHVGADAAVVEQVDGRPQDQPDQLVRRARRRSPGRCRAALAPRRRPVPTSRCADTRRPRAR